MREELQNVHLFNALGGQDVTHTPRMIDEQSFYLQYSLIAEEMDELNHAYQIKDMVEVTDALIDIQYVLFGMVCRFGLHHEFLKGFSEVHKNNMTKIMDGEGNMIVKFREDGKILKPEGYQSVNLANTFPYLKNI